LLLSDKKSSHSVKIVT